MSKLFLTSLDCSSVWLMELAGSPGVLGTCSFFEAGNGVCQLTSSAVCCYTEEACLKLGTAEGPNQLANNSCLWTLSFGNTVLGIQT